MTYKEIEIWIDKYVTTKDYKSKDYVKDKLKGPDKNGSINNWIDNEGYNSKGKSAYDKIITKKIESANDSYIEEIKSQVDKANKEADLDKITIDDNYEKSTRDELETEIESKRAELEETSLPKLQEDVDILFSSRDISGLKSFSSENPEAQRYAEAQLFNATREEIRILRRDEDISGLERLSDKIAGTPDAGELQGEIRDVISRIEKEREETNE